MEQIEHLAERMRIVVRHMSRRAKAVSGTDAPTNTDTGVLGWLDERGVMTASELSVAQHVRPQTMGETLDALESRAWIERRPHPTDRRQILISLTPAGRKALAKGRRLRQAWLAAALARLPARDRRTIATALTIFERFLKTETPP